MNLNVFNHTLSHIYQVQQNSKILWIALANKEDKKRYIDPILEVFPTTCKDLQTEVLQRAAKHDISKFTDNEWPGYYDINCLYIQDSDEAKKAIDHHYKNNDHHPEFWDNDMYKMPGEAILEMLLDWLAINQAKGTNVIEFLHQVAQERWNLNDLTIQYFRSFYLMIFEVKNPLDYS